MYLRILLFFAISWVSAIQFTDPDAGSTLSRGSDFQLTWTSVDTDPTSFSVFLWNFKYYPPFYTYLKTVNTADHATTVTIPCDVASGDGYQFNAIQGFNAYVIYAQSPQFTVDSTECSSPIVGTDPGSCAGLGQDGAPQTVTTTVTNAVSTVTMAAATVTVGQSTVTVAADTVTVGQSTVTVAAATVTIGQSTVTAAAATVTIAQSTVTAAAATVTIAHGTVTAAASTVTIGQSTVTKTKILYGHCSPRPPRYGSRR